MSTPVPEREAASAEEAAPEAPQASGGFASGSAAPTPPDGTAVQRWRSPRWVAALLAAAAGFIAIAVSLLFAVLVPTPEERAIEECRQSVLEQLKAPATAQFGDAKATEGDDGYSVSGYVDAQNGFGALIRTDYRCEPIKLRNGEVTVFVSFT
ncbi:hypothetical protein [Phytomonospora endophytica]|uniref:Uncharacterized protein n=1 Tax=Phytomonospora endophytica TaxID=714109 RepID=A0A841FRF7_9ACTN|nr:hypothetical protein [Phytomonospora endophytica]MBB6035877.1 hypothetical protein [Phytomonospora endophytica]GIG71128.1 hypothetical protein Pen01_74230 [Phytomonospora endophytica]